VITHRRRWLWYGAAFAYVWILYFATNRQNVVPPHPLPLTGVDSRTPFLPWTGWMYATVFVMPLFACLAAETDADVRALVLSFAGMATVDAAIFMAYPTVYPRPGMILASWAGLPLVVVRFFDTAKNCFPSQHVAAAVLTALHIRRLSRTWGLLCLLLALTIAVSTLTTKQHYLWDVIAGALMGGAAYRLSVRGYAATGVLPEPAVRWPST